jgi:hypothetical protein
MSPAPGKIAVLRANGARFAIVSVTHDNSPNHGTIALQGWCGRLNISVRDYSIRYETVNAK